MCLSSFGTNSCLCTQREDERERETDRRWMESERNEGVGKLGEEQRRRGEKGSLFGTSLNYKA